MSHQICVIVPCCNVEKVLKRCVESILKQTMPVDVLLVNDGSTDGTLRIAEEYATKYPNVRVVSKKNAGLPQARKTGLENTDAEYVGFVDADDWVEPDMYEQLFKAVLHNGTDIGCSNFFYSTDQGKNTSGWKADNRSGVIDAGDALHLIHTRKAVFPFLCNKLFKRSLFRYTVFPTGNFVGEDYATILPLMHHVKEISVIEKPLYHYWQVVGSMSKGGFGASHKKAFCSYYRFEKQARTMPKAYQKDVVCYVAVEYMSFLIAMRRNGNHDQKMERYIVHFIRHHLVKICFSEINLKYKISALACAVSSKLLGKMYEICMG